MEVMEGLVLIDTDKDHSKWYESFYYGVEEEGVPIFSNNAEDIEDFTGSTPLSAADYAAQCSVFDIGIGADGNEIVIRHRLQQDREPLLRCAKSDDFETIRTLGANTARIIKKLPLVLDRDSL